MPLLSLALPHPSALPHCRWCAHPHAPATPGLPLLNLRTLVELLLRRSREPGMRPSGEGAGRDPDPIGVNQSSTATESARSSQRQRDPLSMVRRPCPVTPELRAPASRATCRAVPRRVVGGARLPARPPGYERQRARSTAAHAAARRRAARAAGRPCSCRRRHPLAACGSDRALGRMHPPRRAPQVRMRTLGTLLILFTRLPTAAASVSFGSKSALKAALGRWCANGMSATEADGALNTWDVSAVTDMSYLFFATEGEWTSSCRTAFNEPIANWDVRSVTNMNVRRRPPPTSHTPPVCGPADRSDAARRLRRCPSAPACVQQMFGSCYAFNQPLATWDVSSVTNTLAVRLRISRPARRRPHPSRAPRWRRRRASAHRAHRARPPLPPARGVCAQRIFWGAQAFNQPIGNWDVSKNTNMLVRRHPPRHPHVSHSARRRPR